MTTTETTSYRIEDARSPLWFGRWPGGWGDVVHGVEPGEGCSAGAMIDAAGLAWTVEQHPLEAVLGNPDGGEPSRVPVPRVVANVRSDTRAVLGVVGEGYEPLQNRAAFAFCDAITDSGEAHWLGAAETRGGARVHALMQLDRDDPDRGRGGGGRAAAALLPQRPRRRPRGDDQRRAVPARVPERDDAAARRRRADVEGEAHREPGRAARRRAPDARDRLALLRRVGGGRRAADPRADERGRVRALPRRSSCRCPSRARDATNGGRAVRNVERVREAIATAYRATPDLANITGTRWGALQAVTAYVDHVQPTRATAGRSHQEARFERATEPAALKDRALALLTEGGTQS